MATEQVGEPIVEEQAEAGGDEDQIFDTLEDAVDALQDDEKSEEEPVDAAFADEDAESEDDDGVEVTLDGGEKVTLAELKLSYLRNADYTRKTTEVAREREAIEATRGQLAEQTSILEAALQNLSGYLESLVPPEPPLQLARTNPNEYQYQVAARQQIIAELGRLVNIKGDVDRHRAQVSEADARAYRDRENAALLKAMPVLADPGKRAAFDASVTAEAKALGFTEEEISQTRDHRILRLVYLARLGRRAEENRKNATRRVETPKLAKAKPAVPPVNVESRKAMHALSKTGRLQDALKVDFE